VVLCLFLQWPLRELVQRFTREANDLGQIAFALLVAVSITAATRAHAHLHVDILARGYAPKTRVALQRLGIALGIAPWAVFVLIAGRNVVWSSLAALELFPDTYNAGYFLVKAALWLLALLMLIQAALDLARPRPG